MKWGRWAWLTGTVALVAVVLWLWEFRTGEGGSGVGEGEVTEGVRPEVAVEEKEMVEEKEVVEKEMVEKEVKELEEVVKKAEEEEEEEEVVEEVVNRPGRVLGDDPERAARAAEVVVPELAPELGAMGLSVGAPIFVRIFKAERELELWVYDEGDGRYVLFRKYAVAGMSGELGPKLAEGDGQAPEGFYAVGRGRMNPQSSYHLSFDLGYPNAYDRAHGRTGSYLMVHGSTVSVGCFAMTDYGIEEIYTLADAALAGGQKNFRVHVFPFRMTEEAMEEVREDAWFAFWENLREGYLHFERHGNPPEVSVRGLKYAFAAAEVGK